MDSKTSGSGRIKKRRKSTKVQLTNGVSIRNSKIDNLNGED